ncbi:MAG: bifunctional DNA-binding transcriptional regulator/O6-methylguanine-DNA methyltransferase Ada [Chloroflexota bacterium]|nr:bifunctional DNA-binding transcriptional regulator/O6-methylguanine-DNA methyltransferase Ada [Chloroflexota bacterium]
MAIIAAEVMPMSAMPALITTDEDDPRWLAMVSNDRAYDGAFVCAVRTTKIYCRPTCRARLPKRENVSFFDTPDAAERAGYRACKRCHPREAAGGDQQDLVGRICARIDASEGMAPSLDELGSEFGLSPFHLQRVFKRIAGVTPRQYAAARRVERLKIELRADGAVAGAIYGAGFGSSSRVYESAASTLGMTPAAYGKRGAGMRIRYTIAQSPIGRVLVAGTERGIASVCIGDDDAELEETLHSDYAAAQIERDDLSSARWRDAVLQAISDGGADPSLPTDVRATAFQARVWQALREIPAGETRAYHEVAASLGQPKATRAVARACAMNPTAIVVPCHRVVRADGDAGGYRYGTERKRALLENERRKHPPGSASSGLEPAAEPI